ncbi:MAG TPA: hypothetical protein VM677_05920, partial [Actinokineospora sp.]|nr:hypothetical protein [Actinokineospora sp.]
YFIGDAGDGRDGRGGHPGFARPDLRGGPGFGPNMVPGPGRGERRGQVAPRKTKQAPAPAPTTSAAPTTTS